MTTSIFPSSGSIHVEPTDRRCRYWAKRVDAGMPLALPGHVRCVSNLYGPYLPQDEEELAMGDFLIQGEPVHHLRPDRGWNYRLCYVGIDGTLHHVMPSKEHKHALKAGGLPVEYLKGAGELAACVRIIHGLRRGLNAGLVPIETLAVPVSMQDYARAAQLESVWFEPSAEELVPTPWRIYQQAAMLPREASARVEVEELPTLDMLLGD